MSLRILYVAYPLLALSDASCGGAEQMLLTLEREMWRRGHHTVVAAAAGSRVTGGLYSTGSATRRCDLAEERTAEHHSAILRLLDDRKFDLVHDMSGSFWRCASRVKLPLLCSLHLPPELYWPRISDSLPSNVHFNCVSHSQARSFSHLPRMLNVVENGIDTSRFKLTTKSQTRREFLLWMGRICEEKAPHIALEVAATAGLPIVIAGQVYPFSYHQQYFEREVKPRLASYPQAKFVKTPSFHEKTSLLSRARALLVTSQIDETSSLVAMEAMASGTPVIAFRRGALPEVVEHGVTGFVMDTVSEMVEAISKAGDIDRTACRTRVRELYSSARMADDYEDLYSQVLGRAARRQSVA